MSCTVCHVLIRCTQIDGHLDIQGRNRNNTEDLAVQTVIYKHETGHLIGRFSGQTCYYDISKNGKKVYYTDMDQKFYIWLIENMYEICERDLDVLEEMITCSCNIKRMVVEKDPTEQGERALLNFGHTIGHAIEKAKNFTMTHGECISLGMVAAAFISWKRNKIGMETYYEIRDMFVPFYLPISVDEIDAQEILKLTKSDKKADAGTIKFILLNRIGQAVIDTTVTEDEILEALNEIIYVEED